MTQLAPPKILKINVTRLDPLDAYGSEPFASQPWKFRVRLLVEPQIHSDLRTPRPGIYNGFDVVPGNFISTQRSKILKIDQIESQTADQLICICSDTNRINSSIDENQTGESAIETGYGLLFTATKGVPVLFPLPGNIQGISTSDLIGIIGRFFYSDASGFAEGVLGYTGSQGYRGYTGSRGPSGTNIVVKGNVPTASDLPPTGNAVNDSYFADDTKELWIWSSAGNWYSAGRIVGPTGDVGYTGSAGYTGSQGISGYTGSQGLPGDQGGIGFTGSQGYVGSRGVEGPAGPIGYAGSQGETGYVGSRGLQGFRGELGYTGSQGPQGAPGTAGGTGASGYTGSQGIQGFAGPSGYAGSRGSLGYTGSIGYTGSTGIMGYTGSTGGDGADGYTGSRGYTGSNGPNAIGQATISQVQAENGAVLVYSAQVNEWAPKVTLDAQIVEGGFF